jgi:hypothetical protein
MKKCAVFFVVLAIVLGQHVAFALDDDSGFTEEGIGIKTPSVTRPGQDTVTAASQTLYHLLIIDRSSAVSGDISGVAKDALLYKAKHGKTGYLIALYKVSKGSQAVVLPANASIVLDLVASRKSTIGAFANSPAMKVFVTEAKVLEHLKEALTLE